MRCITSVFTQSIFIYMCGAENGFRSLILTKLEIFKTANKVYSHVLFFRVSRRLISPKDSTQSSQNMVVNILLLCFEEIDLQKTTRKSVTYYEKTSLPSFRHSRRFYIMSKTSQSKMSKLKNSFFFLLILQYFMYIYIYNSNNKLYS